MSWLTGYFLVECTLLPLQGIYIESGIRAHAFPFLLRFLSALYHPFEIRGYLLVAYTLPGSQSWGRKQQQLEAELAAQTYVTATASGRSDAVSQVSRAERAGMEHGTGSMKHEMCITRIGTRFRFVYDLERKHNACDTSLLPRLLLPPPASCLLLRASCPLPRAELRPTSLPSWQIFASQVAKQQRQQQHHHQLGVA